MRYLILADVHSNLEAFAALLAAAEAEGEIEEIWCLGDMVGYGPDPHHCLQLLRRYPHICVAGNHDLAAIGRIDTSQFNAAAAAAARWTAEHLAVEDREYLEALPLKLERGDFTLVHGSPREPVWEYLLSPEEARASLAYFTTRFCLIGHSHIPLLFEFRDSRCQLSLLPPSLPLGRNRMILNPGGAGQPRDQDPRASFVIYDSEASHLRHFRVAYPVATTQEKMRRLGLPHSLADRLSYGW